MECQDLPSKTLLRPDEVASFLSICPKTVYRWYQAGILGGTKLNGTLRIYRESLLGLMRANEQLGIIETQQRTSHEAEAPPRDS